MSINNLSYNMVEVPKIPITRKNFADAIRYLRGVKWWGLQNEATKRTYFIDNLDRECREELIKLENASELTLRQWIGRLESKFLITNTYDDGFQAGKKAESKRILMCLKYENFSQQKNESLADIWNKIERIDNDETSFEGRLAIFAGLCAKSLKKYINWQNIESETDIKEEISRVDYKHNLQRQLNACKNELRAEEKAEEEKSREQEKLTIIKLNDELKTIKDLYKNDVARYELQISTLNELVSIYKSNKESILRKNECSVQAAKENNECSVQAAKEEIKNISKCNAKVAESKKKENIKPRRNKENIISNDLPEKLDKKEDISKVEKIEQNEIILNIKNKANDTAEIINKEVASELNEDVIRNSYGTITDTNIYDEGYPDETCNINTEEGKMIKGNICTLKKGLYDKVLEVINDLMIKKYIKESDSEWNNPIRPVLKPDGSIRLCMNMMALNEITYGETHPIPDIENIIDSMQGAEFFSVLDLKEGYFQIRLSEADQYKTAFTINQQKYEWTRMPMGYKNAPAIFQRIMEKELREWLYKGCMVYLDDIVVYGKTIEEHDKVLYAVLNKLKEKRLKINANKLQLRKKTIRLLGMEIDGKTVKMPQEMRDKIMEFKIPKTKKELQRFLGSVIYHRRFINDIGKKTQILHEILKDNMSMADWTDEHSKAFNNLQDEANTAVTRYHPDYSKEFILETDASNNGVGALLYQINDMGERQIIKPIASKLKKSEVNWGITEKEVYAIVWALQKLEMYLIGRKVKIITDHKAACWIKQKESFGNARIQRWMEILQYFDFEIEYRSGDEMYEADALSRLFKEDKKIEMTETQESLIKKIHEEIGHRGTDVTEYALKKHYTRWNNQKTHIQEVLAKCEICIRNKVKDSGGAEYIETERKMQKVGVDILEYDNTYMLLGIDYYTRYMFGSVLKSKNSSEIKEKLVLWFKKFGNPEELVFDQGLEFNNAIIEEMCLSRDIKRHLISTDHHQSNGRVERLNRTIREYLRKNDSHRDINKEEVLGRAMYSYNNSLHSVIKMSPEEAWLVGESDKDIKVRNSKQCPYAKTFKKRNRDEFIKRQIVAVKKTPLHKEDTKFSETGEILDSCGNDTYLVKMNSKIFKKSHADINLLPIEQRM